MKYVVFQCCDKDGSKDTQFLLPVLFPKAFKHSDISESIEHTRVFKNAGEREWWWPTAVSAGFFNGDHCYGYSESLGLKCHADDTAIIKEHFCGQSTFKR